MGSEQYSGLFHIILDLIKNDFSLLKFAFFDSSFFSDFFINFRQFMEEILKELFKLLGTRNQTLRVLI